MDDPRVYFGKKVQVVDTDGDKHIGIVDSYAYAKDNDGQNAITLSTGIWLDDGDIQSIKIID